MFGQDAIYENIYDNKLLSDKDNARDNDIVNDRVDINKNTQGTERNEAEKIMEVSYKALQGNQLKILKRIISLCDKSGQTGMLCRDDFSEFEIRAFKTNIVRLIKKGFIVRGKYQKKGRGGYFSFELTQAMKSFLKNGVFSNST